MTCPNCGKRQMWPTPNASLSNYGESFEQWEARRKQVQARGINGNGMGMPLGIAVQVDPTGGCECSRSEAFSPVSEGLISASSEPVCKLCGSASRTPIVSGSSLGTGLESRAIPTCAPWYSTPTVGDSKSARNSTATRHVLPPTGIHAGNTLTDMMTLMSEGLCPCRCHTLMSSAAGSPARTFPTPAREQGSMGNVRVFGQSTPDSFATFDPVTSSWRTSQLSLLEDSGEFSETWPRAGMTRNGTAFRLRPLAPLTAGIGSGLLHTPTAKDERETWPTPTASERTGHSTDGGKNLRTVVSETSSDGGSLNPTWVEWLMGFPLGWTDLGASGIVSSRRSPSSSAEGSSNGSGSLDD